MTRTAVAVILVSFFAVPLFAQTTIDNMPANPACFISSFGVPAAATYGQTITAPLTDTVLQSFSFIEYSVPATLTYRAEVYAWDGAKATGPALFESAPVTGSGDGFHTVTFNTGGVQLTGGGSYVLFVTASKDYYISSGSGPMATNCGPTYLGGTFVYFNNAWDFDSLTTYGWQTLGVDMDLAFQAVFAPPPAADLVVTKSDSADPVDAGQSLTYTIAVNNAGTLDAANVVISDTLPAGIVYSSATGQSSSCSFATSTVTCSMATLAAGATETVTLVTSVDPGVASGTVLSNTASVTTDTSQNTANDSATEETTVQTEADLSIAKSGSNGVLAGGQTDYTITVANHGPSDAQNVVMTDVLPAGTTFLGITQPAGFTCVTPAAGANGTVTCTAATLAAGALPSQFVLTVGIDPGVTTGTTIQNVASVSSDTNDPTPADNASGATATASVMGVPTVSEWGLLALLMAFAVFGALRLRA